MEPEQITPTNETIALIQAATVIVIQPAANMPPDLMLAAKAYLMKLLVA